MGKVKPQKTFLSQLLIKAVPQQLPQQITLTLSI